MAVSFQGSTLVSDTLTHSYYGDAKFFQGEVEQEIYAFSVPRSSGIGEKSSGKRQRRHRLEVIWHTNAESTIRTNLDTLQAGGTYGTLSIPNYSTDGYLTFPYCRLERVDYGQRMAGRRADGNACTVMFATLFFLQVRF